MDVPLYEYRCAACRKRSAVLLARWDSKDPPCSHCGAARLQRLVSTFATTRSEGGDSDLADFGEDAYDGGGDDLDGGDFGGYDDL